MVELLSSACPHTAMLMGLDAPTSDDHTRLVVTPRPTQSWFTITDHDGQAVDLNQPTAALMAHAILRRLAHPHLSLREREGPAGEAGGRVRV